MSRLIFGILIFLCFLFPFVSFADISQPQTDITLNYYLSSVRQTLGTGLSGNLTRFFLSRDADIYGVYWGVINILECSDASYSAGCVNVAHLSCHATETNCDKTMDHYGQPLNVFFNSDKYYFFEVSGAGIGLPYLKGTTFDSFAGGEVFGNNLNGLQDFTFSLFGVNNAPATPDSGVTLLYPQNGYVGLDFEDFRVSYHSNEATTTDIFLTYEKEGYFLSQLIKYDAPTTATTTDFLMPKNKVLTDGSYSVSLVLKTGEGETLASATSSFMIDIFASSTGGITKPSCSGGGWIEDSFCKILSYMFIPSDDSLNRFVGLWDKVKNKSPFAYITPIISGFSFTPSVQPAFSLAFEENSVFSSLKTGISGLLWIVLGIFILKFFRQLQV